MLRRSPALGALNPVAAAHHEKADGSGYHKHLRADAVDPGAGVLAAADTYVGLTTDRADRPAFSGKFAATELRRLASQGVLEQRTAQSSVVLGNRNLPRPSEPGDAHREWRTCARSGALWYRSPWAELDAADCPGCRTEARHFRACVTASLGTVAAFLNQAP